MGQKCKLYNGIQANKWKKKLFWNIDKVWKTIVSQQRKALKWLFVKIVVVVVVVVVVDVVAAVVAVVAIQIVTG